MSKERLVHGVPDGDAGLQKERLVRSIWMLLLGGSKAVTTWADQGTSDAAAAVVVDRPCLWHAYAFADAFHVIPQHEHGPPVGFNADR